MNLQRIYQIRLPALIYMVNLTAKKQDREFRQCFYFE